MTIKTHLLKQVEYFTNCSTDELNEIKKYIPDFKCEYKPDFRQNIADSWPKSIDDSPAQKEWGWAPKYDLSAVTKDMIEKLKKRYEKENL